MELNMENEYLMIRCSSCSPIRRLYLMQECLTFMKQHFQLYIALNLQRSSCRGSTDLMMLLVEAGRVEETFLLYLHESNLQTQSSVV